ncbi:MAG: hypothetical protein WCW14_01960 [Candidatus Paceibacterota bacterium]|jgi:hypothetical protein
MMHISSQGGFLKIIILIIVAILVLSYFGFNIQSIVESPTTQTNLAYVKSLVVGLWNNVLKTPVMYLYNEIWLKYLWFEFIRLMDSVKANQTPEWYAEHSPNMNFSTSSTPVTP